MSEPSQEERLGTARAPDEAGSGKHQRKLRNYLLDKRFQLKYTGIVIGITVFLSCILGYYLYREIVISQETILARDLATDTYIIEPGDFEMRQRVGEILDEEFNEALQSKVRVVAQINNAPTGSTANLYEDQFREEVRQKTTVLVSALGIFLLILAVVWVYLTHKIAGPVYKLGLLFSKVDGDRLRVAGRLRKGDELQETFLAFRDMIDRLRDHRRAQADRLVAIIARLEKGHDGPMRPAHADSEQDVIVELHEIESRMRASLDE